LIYNAQKINPNSAKVTGELVRKSNPFTQTQANESNISSKYKVTKNEKTSFVGGLYSGRIPISQNFNLFNRNQFSTNTNNTNNINIVDESNNIKLDSTHNHIESKFSSSNNIAQSNNKALVQTPQLAQVAQVTHSKTDTNSTISNKITNQIINMKYSKFNSNSNTNHNYNNPDNRIEEDNNTHSSYSYTKDNNGLNVKSHTSISKTGNRAMTPNVPIKSNSKYNNLSFNKNFTVEELNNQDKSNENRSYKKEVDGKRNYAYKGEKESDYSNSYTNFKGRNNNINLYSYNLNAETENINTSKSHHTQSGLNKSHNSQAASQKEQHINSRNLNNSRLQKNNSGPSVKSQSNSNNNNNNSNTSAHKAFVVSHIQQKKLIELLAKIQLLKYYDLFIENGFEDLSWIVEQTKKGNYLKDSTLKEIGITQSGERGKIHLAIEEIAGTVVTERGHSIYYTPSYVLHKDYTSHNSSNYSINMNNSHNKGKHLEEDLFSNPNYVNNFERDIKCIGIKKWLREMGLDYYFVNFLREGYYSLDLIFYQSMSHNPISDGVLERDMGIAKIGHRNRILNKIKGDYQVLLTRLETLNTPKNKRSEDGQCCSVF